MAQNFFSPQDDNVILTRNNVVAARLLARPYGSVKHRRYLLKAGMAKSMPKNYWTKEETAILKKMWPTCSVKECAPYLPGKTLQQIRWHAASRKIKKIYNGNARMQGLGELIDQIKIRAKQDGFTFKQLDATLKTGTYFQRTVTTQRKYNLAKIVKALEFFGAQLVIDWNDR